MVTRYGMSEKLGPRTFGKREEMVFLGKEISEQRDYSEGVAAAIDEEVLGLVDNAYQNASRIISSNRDKLDKLAQYLIQNETIEGDQLTKMLDDDSSASGTATAPSPSSA